MAKLYEIINEIENFKFDIDEETGEILNCEELDMLFMDRNIKIENLCLWVKNLKSDAKAYKDESDSFLKKKKQAENKATSIEKYIQHILNGEKFKTDKVSVSYRKSEQVHCEDIRYVDDDYLRYKEPELDKTKIKAALKQGVEIKGCSLVEKQNMQIK